MFFEIVENSIKNRLIAKIQSGIDIVVMPESQAQFATPVTKTKISVCYKQSDYDSPKSTSETVQQENMQFELYIQGKVLRGSNGIYDAHLKSSKALLGFTPTHCGRIYAVNFQILERDRETGIFTYVYTIACRGEAVMLPDEVEEPTLASIQINPTDTAYDSVEVTN